jgi:hypothetical protein
MDNPFDMKSPEFDIKEIAKEALTDPQLKQQVKQIMSDPETLNSFKDFFKGGARKSRRKRKRKTKKTRKRGGTLNKKTKRKLDAWGVDVNAKGDLTKFEKKVYPEDYSGYTMNDAIKAKRPREFKLLMERNIAENKKKKGGRRRKTRKKRKRRNKRKRRTRRKRRK